MRRFAYSSVVQLTWHHSTTSLPRFLKRSQIDYLFFGGMAGMALRCSDRPILVVLGPACEGPRAAPVVHALSLGMTTRSYQESVYPWHLGSSRHSPLCGCS